ncbi:MAG TPA: penicillin acylase family protein, partial [Vicinamibacterales bacterium]|nr:penicillin acylase family protein [Vicinamibacterales bacterium]
MKRLLVVLTLLLAISAGASSWWWVRSSLPVLDGQVSLPGLSSPVEVLFDPHGVPHVYATNEDTAWFAAGALHARDRRWQMELYRRVTTGRLSEALGDTTIPFDQRFLTLGLRAAAEAEWQRASPQVRAALEAYAAGVNAATSLMIGRLRPVEFQILGITPPDWTPLDSLAVGRLLTWRLAENHRAELVRAALVEKFGETAARQLTGVYPSSAPAILDGVTRPPQSLPAPVARVIPPGLEWLSGGMRRGNSNNWVLASGRTKAGRPLLANDPHLPIEFPSVWYEMHLVAAGLDVIGVTIPGVPFVVLGHNARIAWGMTATNADVQDLALERIDVGRKRAMYRGEWVPVEVTQADIPVRGRSQPLPFEVWKTRNGPIFAD